MKFVTEGIMKLDAINETLCISQFYYSKKFKYKNIFVFFYKNEGCVNYERNSNKKIWKY